MLPTIIAKYDEVIMPDIYHLVRMYHSTNVLGISYKQWIMRPLFSNIHVCLYIKSERDWVGQYPNTQGFSIISIEKNSPLSIVFSSIL